MADATMLTPPVVTRFARELASIRRELDAVRSGQTSTQMDFSSIMGPLYVRDPVTGDLLGSIGTQPDGGVATIPVGGPPPPQMSDPILTPGIHTVTVEWNGSFAGGAARPTNFAFGAVHASQVGANFITDPSNLVATLTDAGTVPIGPYQGQVWVRFVGYNTSTPPVTGPASGTVSTTPNQVVAQAVLDGIVTETALADQAVSQLKVKLGAIGAGQLGGQAVTAAALASGAVGAPALAQGAVTTPAIAPGAVTAEVIAANTVTAGQIAAQTIGAGQLGANSVIAGKVDADAITARELIANSVGALELIAGAVQAGKIAANAVTANEILAGAVTAGKLAANSVTAGAITAGAVTAAKLESNLILTNRLIAGSLTGTRAEVNASGFEAWSGSMKTFDVDASNGTVMMLGAYKTADTGTRIELGGSNGADVIRFYQGSNYAYLNAESAPGNTAALIGRSQAGSNSRGSFGCYPTEGFISLTNAAGTISESAYSAIKGIANVWAGALVLEGREQYGSGEITFGVRSSGGSYRGSRELRIIRQGTNEEPALWGSGQNIKLVFSGGGLFVQNNASALAPIAASAFNGPSSVTIKKNVRRLNLSRRSTARRALADVEAMTWLYDHERAPGDPEAPPATVVTRLPVRERSGRVAMDGNNRPIFEDVSTVPTSAPAVRPHIFPTAEDLAAVIPELVNVDPGVPGGLSVDYRDVTGFLWLVSREQEIEIRSLAERVDRMSPRAATPGPIQVPITEPVGPTGQGQFFERGGTLWYMSSSGTTRRVT